MDRATKLHARKCFRRIFTCKMEVRGGIEPPNRAFAELGLTTWLPHRSKTSAQVGSKNRVPQEVKYRGGGGFTRPGRPFRPPISAYAGVAPRAAPAGAASRPPRPGWGRPPPRRPPPPGPTRP